MSHLSWTDRVVRSRTGSRCSTRFAAPARKTALRVERLEPRRLLSATASGTGTGTGTGAADGDGPTVLSVQRYGFHDQPTILVLQFSQALDPTPAQNPSNYIIRNHKSRPVGIAAAVYDAANDTVTLYPRRLINLHHPAQLLVVGRIPTGVTNTAGVLLDGANTGQPGTDFSALLTRRDLAGPASAVPVSGAANAPAAAVDAALGGWDTHARGTRS